MQHTNRLQPAPSTSVIPYLFHLPPMHQSCTNTSFGTRQSSRGLLDTHMVPHSSAGPVRFRAPEPISVTVRPIHSASAVATYFASSLLTVFLLASAYSSNLHAFTHLPSTYLQLVARVFTFALRRTITFTRVRVYALRGYHTQLRAIAFICVHLRS